MNRREVIASAGALAALIAIPAGAAVATVAADENERFTLLSLYLAGCVHDGHMSADAARALLRDPDNIPWSAMPLIVRGDFPPLSDEEFALAGLGAQIMLYESQV